MKKHFLLLTFFALSHFLFCGQLLSNDSLFVRSEINGWRQTAPKKLFTPATLFNHIDGGAEIFLEFGFRQCTIFQFSRDSLEIELEIYEMENPTAALGIYLLKCGNETPIKTIHSRNSCSYLQIIAVKNRFYLQLNNFSDKRIPSSQFSEFINSIFDPISSNYKIPLLDELPTENRIEHSIFLFRGPYALEPVFTFGNGDIFQLNGRIFGIGADYTNNDTKFTRMAIPYPDSLSARRALSNFVANHDPYLKILQQNENAVTFQDFQNKFGKIELCGNKVVIKIDLPLEPE